jgi:hypothetical protein
MTAVERPGSQHIVREPSTRVNADNKMTDLEMVLGTS